MQLKTRSAVMLFLSIFWGIIGISMVTGIWQTKATTEEVVVNSPSDIKGWMTLTDVSAYFKVPVPELVKVLGLPADVETKQPLKEIAGENGKEVDDLREILATYLGGQSAAVDAKPGGEAAEKQTQPKEQNGGSAGSRVSAPTSAAVSTKTVSTDNNNAGQTLNDKAAANQDQPTARNDSNAVAPAKTTQPAETPKSPGDGSGESEVIKGKMTLSEVEFATKVPASYICKQLGIPENTDRGVALRDLGQQYGFEVDSIRDIVAKYKP